MATENNFEVWKNDTPVVNVISDLEFDAWENNAPDEDIDEGVAPVAAVRRRVFIF